MHESGQIQLQDLEAHIKDDVEREGGKITEMTRKVKQAYKEVVSVLESLGCEDRAENQATAPVIEDDMLFNENGAMLTEWVLREIAFDFG